MLCSRSQQFLRSCHAESKWAVNLLKPFGEVLDTLADTSTIRFFEGPANRSPIASLSLWNVCNLNSISQRLAHLTHWVHGLRYIGLCTLGLCIHRAWRPHSPEPYEYMRVRSLFHELIPRVAAHLFQILSVAPFPDPRTLIDAHKALNFGHSGQSDLEDHLSLIGKSYPSPGAFASPEGWRQRRSLP